MPLNMRLDHTVINVGFRMDIAKTLFENLGFNLTPRGNHSTGSINHLAIFGNDYLELIGLPKSGKHDRPDIANASMGINGIVFKTGNAETTYKHLKNLNFQGLTPKSFSRPVALEEGIFEAKFRTVTVKPEVFLGGRVYFCEHFTPELIWRPEWQDHPNGVEKIREFVVVSTEPLAEAQSFAKLLMHKKNTGGQINFDDCKITVLSESQYRDRFGVLASSLKDRGSIFGGIIFKTNNRQQFNFILDKGVEGVQSQIEKFRTLVRIPSFDTLIEFID